MVIKMLNKIAGNWNYTFKKNESAIPNDILSDQEFCMLYEQCKHFTMTSVERMYSLYQSIDYIFKNDIEGDFVECGVWKGGSSMLMAMMLKQHGMTNKKLYLYDTFEGMSEPT
ncbi:MAG TPA: TylF/MycF/NovP-related O-methyltransferase, partial [Hanamia sp.]|nr:TylF/MycF/NovP-related O-methyltransferase [Hanamia sp.]